MKSARSHTLIAMLRVVRSTGRGWRQAASARYSVVKTTPEVARAIAEGRPVVALESTIISHGMPYPRNLEMAKEVEAVIRNNGAVPATVAIIDGIPKVGLTESDLLKLANSGSGVVLKASTRDIAHACATKATAATTVASTMKLAHLAGISVFATGGIGGVHRGVESTMDISADLLELSRTPVTVVCAGIKSILDIPKSLEVLETNSVPVLSYGTNVFPAFYTNDSGIPSPRAVDSASDIASIMGFQRRLGLHSGVLVAVPNPAPASGDKIQYAINFALTSAKNEGITGAKVTPYVLDKVQQLTGGESLESNIALVLNNARVAAGIAVDYANLLKQDASLCTTAGNAEHKLFTVAQTSNAESIKAAEPAPVSESASPVEALAATVTGAVSSAPKAVTGTSGAEGPSNATAAGAAAGSGVPSARPSRPTAQSAGSSTQPEIVVVGGAVVDLIGHISTMTKLHTSNPGRLSISHGGVGRNIAESLARLGRKVSLATAVAGDLNGRSLVEVSSEIGIDMSLVRVLSGESASEESTSGSADASKSNKQLAGHSTAIYNAIHDNHGDLCIGIADMSIFAQVTPEYVQQQLAPAIAQSRIVATDGNISKEAFAAVADLCAQQGVPLFFEPTSDHKCLLPFHAGRITKVDIMKPNVTELVQMVNHCLSSGMINSGRALVQNTLSTIAGNRIDQTSLQDHMEVSDLRVLLNALYQVMTGQAGASHLHATPKTGFLGGLLRQDSNGGNKNSASTASIPAQAVPQPTAAGHQRAVSGKHIIVSMGGRGLLWCGPAKHLSAAAATVPSLKESGACVVNEATQSATVFVPAMSVNAADIVHTNGAGDALCAGLLAEIIRKASVGATASADGASHLPLPDMDSIQKGLLSAHHWLVSK